ncbi:MAG: UDP-N-acetylmuramoyl-tripeptide--D-alanyl-D-alanine ligase [Arenimonas sp.]
MRPVLLSQIAEWCEARLLGDDINISHVSTDTRALTKGSLFVALRGESFDAHDFIANAELAGAAAVLVSRPVETLLPQILCADTQEALAEFAAGIQQGRKAVVVALTGSNGKTSVKNLITEILGRTGLTYSTPGNRNNEIGLPMAVLEAPEDAEFAIYEMGAGKPGDIAYLCSIVAPQVSVINNIDSAHLERMGSLLGIAETKGAIYEALSDDGVAVINADDAFAPYFSQRVGHRRVFRYGIENDADIRACNIQLHIENSVFDLLTPAGRQSIMLNLPGRHNVMNALAATGLALGAGAHFDAIVQGLQNAVPVKGRQISYVLDNEAVLIDDSYNANPGSVAAAIQTLAQNKIGSWLVLGNMAELGEGGARLHAEIGDLAKKSGIEKFWTVGNLAKNASAAFGNDARHFESKVALSEALIHELQVGSRCLVKGSRSSAMDEVVKAVLKELKQKELLEKEMTQAISGGSAHAA